MFIKLISNKTLSPPPPPPLSMCTCSISGISPSWARAGCKKTLRLLHYPRKIKFIHSFILFLPPPPAPPSPRSLSVFPLSHFPSLPPLSLSLSNPFCLSWYRTRQLSLSLPPSAPPHPPSLTFLKVISTTLSGNRFLQGSENK